MGERGEVDGGFGGVFLELGDGVNGSFRKRLERWFEKGQSVLRGGFIEYG